MVQERSCPDGMIFDTRVQECNWEGGVHQAKCEDLSPSEEDAACWCGYATTACTNSLQALTAETISTWAFPRECLMANTACPASIGLAGDTLFQTHKTKACTWCIKPACEEGNPQDESCIDQVTQCCGGTGPECDCEAIAAACERGHAKACTMYADTCCTDDIDPDCKCRYRTKSCAESLGSALEGTTLSQDCIDAEEVCSDCTPLEPVQGQDIGSCQSSCKFWDQLCVGNPGRACHFSAGRCCGSPNHLTHNAQCYCEISDYLSQTLNHELEYQDACKNAEEAQFVFDSNKEKESLIKIFKELGGAEWRNENDSWLANDTEHCDWYGVTCDQRGQVVELDLTRNNLAGTMNASQFFAPLNKLKVLILTGNKLEGMIDFNSFYPLTSLKHVDLSHNELSGDVDVLLAPALQSLNLSGNNFASMVFFKFRASQNTFEKLDLTKNDIRQDVSRILENTPPSLKELVLVENHVYGHLPTPLPVLVHLERFIIRSNHMTGQIPELSQSFQKLEELDLSHQSHNNTGGLSGPIPDLPEIIALDLSRNRLTGAIPPSIGNLPRLKKFVVSNNMLSGGIPKTLRKLTGTCEVLDMSNNVLATIPPEFGDFKSSPNTVVNLRGNANL